ncbi:beta strand repeat-containing protein [Nocardioides stalactiti]|uniref:beta strand repeat-containing protein n=1 Tax=Nocardioides stalactiti TaxID=2755356 RepID=UPI001602834D|nr:Ig-like domain-containing protein [Nocardioides stalactiti]
MAITNAGADLTYEPDADYCNDGVTTDDFTYTLAPGGGTATVTVTVTCVTDGQVAVDDTKTVDEDDPATTIDVLGNDSDPESAGLTVASVTQPTNGTVAITNAGADLTYEPDADYCNDGVTTDDFTYTLGSGDTAEVKVTVTCVNDAPVADDESFTGASAAVGNTVLVVDDATDAAPSEAGPHKTVSGDLLAGDTDPEGDTLTVTAETVTSTDGGSAVIEADGDFVFTPAPGCTDTTDTFDYELSDGTDTDAGTVTIDLSGCVWYVNNSTTGSDTGVSNAPFNTLVEAQNASSVGNTIYVYDGDDTTTGYAAGITLKANQRLLGELADLVIGSDTLATGVAGKRPTLTNTGADVVTLDDNNTVQGIEVDPSGAGGGIAGGTGDVGGTIADVRIIDTGTAGTQPSLELDGTSSLWTISDLTVNSTGATGVRLNNAGTVTFVDTGTIIVATTGAKVLDLNQTSLVNSVIDGAIVTGSSTGGIQATNASGSMTLGAVNLTSSGGTALALTSSTGWSVPNIGSATAQILATAGPAVDVQSSDATLSFDYITSTNSTGDGINLDGLGAGTFTTTDGLISGAAGIAFDVNGGNGAITYPGIINNGTGDTVEVTGRTGGTVSFTGAVSDTNDAGGGINLNANTGGTTQFTASSVGIQTTTTNAVSMTASDGHTLQFTGGSLYLTATTGRALNANASGTLAVTGTNNQASTTGGRVISIVTTDIGAADVTFQTVGVQAGTGTNGIVLDTTGSLGSLVVTGAGGQPCSIADPSGCNGGSIEQLTGADDATSVPTGTAIVLKDTTGPSFADMSLRQNYNFGIRATNVVGLTLDNVLVSESGINQSGVGSIDSNIYATNLTGSVSIANSEITGGSQNNLWVQNSAGSLDRITLDANTFGTNSNQVPAEDSIHLETENTAGALKATITNNSVNGAGGDMVQFLHNGAGVGDLDLSYNVLDNQHLPAAIASGGGGVTIFSGGAMAATTTMTISNNDILGADGNGVLIVKGSGPSTQTGTFTNNGVGSTTVNDSGSINGAALKLWSLGQGTMAWTVDGNTISEYGLSGIEVQAGDVPGQSGSVDMTITNNTIDHIGTGTGIAIFGIRLNAGTGAGDSYQVCADIQDNAVNTSGDADGAAPAVAGDDDLRLRQRFLTTVRLPGYAGANNDDFAVETFVNGNNNSPAGTSSFVSNNVAGGGGGYVGGAACSTPVVP